MNKVYQIVTDRIIASLEKGEVPWQQTWNNPLPANLVTGYQYTGMNLFLLYLNNLVHKYSTPYYLTYKQAMQLGGTVKKGERSELVVFWTKYDSKTEKDKKGNPKKIFVLRYYNVFNADQCEGLKHKRLEEKPTRSSVNDFAECEKIIAGYEDKPELRFGDLLSPLYNLSKDVIEMPTQQRFATDHHFYATLFHEMIHSTGHENRLNRLKNQTNAVFGSESYSKEELIAELGAAFICAETGISNFTENNQTAYIRGWIKKLQDDPEMIVRSASKAQRAVRYMKYGKKGK